MSDADIGDDDAPDAQDDAPKRKKTPGKKLVVLVLAPLLLIGGLGGAYMSGALDSLLGGETAAADGESADAADTENAAADYQAVYFSVPEMTVNLKAVDGHTAYLQLTVVLELKSEDDLAEVERVLPRVVDQFQTYLRELRVVDLEGSSGIYRLREELLARLNSAIASAHITDVLFERMLVQS